MRGRKPKPVAIKKLEGNRSKEKLPEEVVIGGRPNEPMEPPESLDDDAKEFWAEAVPILHKVGLLDTVDRAALEMTATAYARVLQARRVIAEEGMMSVGHRGQPREHPMLSTERAAMQTFLRFAEQYALTPVARTRLGLAELQRRSMEDELTDALGPPQLEAVT